MDIRRNIGLIWARASGSNCKMERCTILILQTRLGISNVTTAYNPMELMICCAARSPRRTAAPSPSAPGSVRRRDAGPAYRRARSGHLLRGGRRRAAVADDADLRRRFAHLSIAGIMATSMADVMETCQRGMMDYTFLGGAQIDPFGNLNSTMIGDDYDKPKVRLARQRRGQRSGVVLLADHGGDQSRSPPLRREARFPDDAGLSYRARSPGGCRVAAGDRAVSASSPIWRSWAITSRPAGWRC